MGFYASLRYGRSHLYFIKNTTHVLSLIPHSRSARAGRRSHARRPRRRRPDRGQAPAPDRAARRRHRRALECPHCTAPARVDEMRRARGGRPTRDRRVPTQSSSWTAIRLPDAQATWSGVRCRRLGSGQQMSVEEPVTRARRSVSTGHAAAGCATASHSCCSRQCAAALVSAAATGAGVRDDAPAAAAPGQSVRVRQAGTGR